MNILEFLAATTLCALMVVTTAEGGTIKSVATDANRLVSLCATLEGVDREYCNQWSRAPLERPSDKTRHEDNPHHSEGRVERAAQEQQTTAVQTGPGQPGVGCGCVED